MFGYRVGLGFSKRTRVFDIIDCLCLLLLFVFLTFSIYWVIVFIRRIISYRKYKRGVARCVTDEESAYLNKQFCYHYDTEIWKYVYLLAIILLEILSGSLFVLVNFLPQYYWYNSFFNSSENTTGVFSIFVQCRENRTIVVDGDLNIIISELTLIYGIGRSTQLFIPIFIVCLMNYLIIRIKKIKYYRRSSNPRYLVLITILITLFTFISNLIQTLRVLSQITFEIALAIYFCLLIITSNQFKRALLQRTLQRLIQHGSNKIEMKQYRYFKYTINMICLGFLLIFTGQCSLRITRLYVGVLINPRCYFPFYLFSQFIQPNPSVDKVYKYTYYIAIIGRVVGHIGIIIGLTPFILLTIIIWIVKIQKLIRGTPKKKYTTVPSHLTVSLLAN